MRRPVLSIFKPRCLSIHFCLYHIGEADFMYFLLSYKSNLIISTETCVISSVLLTFDVGKMKSLDFGPYCKGKASYIQFKTHVLSAIKS